MTKIRCPKCRQSGDLKAQGRWYVQCSECQARFVLHIVRQKPVAESLIACPHCGYGEKVAAEGYIVVDCPACSRQFLYNGDEDQ